MLRFIFLAGISCGIGFGSAVLFYEIIDVNPGDVIGWGTVIVFSYIAWAVIGKKTAKDTAKDVYEKAVTFKEEIKNTQENIQKKIVGDELSYMAEAESEIQNNNYDKNLWSKALVDAEGNEEKRKAIYIKLRAKQLAKLNK